MNFAVSIRQPEDILKQADEIIVNYKDIQGLYNIVETCADKVIIVRIPADAATIDWIELSMFATQFNNLYIALADLSLAPIAKSNSLKFYWAYPVTSYYELHGLIDLGISQVILGAPLYFDLEQVAKLKIPIRLIANVCFDNYITRVDGIQGTYIRPEDVDIYGKYVSSIEFITDTLAKESTLLKVYQKKDWPGNLNLLLTNFNCNIDNRAIPSEFAEMRMRCRQNCMRTGACQYCQTVMKFNQAVNKAHWDRKA